MVRDAQQTNAYAVYMRFQVTFQSIQYLVPKCMIERHELNVFHINGIINDDRFCHDNVAGFNSACFAHTKGLGLSQRTSA